MRLVAAAVVRAVPPLVGPVIRAVHWTPLLVVTPVVPVLAGLLSLAGPAGQDGLSDRDALLVLRATGLLLAAAAAFVLVDGMAGSTAVAPSPRWLRQWLRSALAFGYAAVAWTGTYALVAGLTPGGPPPLPGTALEAAVLVLVGLTGAAVAVRWVAGRPAALAGAATLFVLLGASLLVPEPWSPWAEPGTPPWDATHTGWLAALPVPLGLLAYAHRDLR